MAKPPHKKLTEKQRVFCEEYLVDLNATQAAIRAGYNPNSAAEGGYENLRKPHIQEYITELKTKRSEKTGVDAEWVLRELVGIHNLDIIDILDEQGNFKSVLQWPKPWRIYLSGFDISEVNVSDTETVIRKIKWPDKVKNLELIGKHVKVQAFNEKSTQETTHKLDKSLEERLTGGSKR